MGNIDRREFLAYCLVGFGKASAVMGRVRIGEIADANIGNVGRSADGSPHQTRSHTRP